MDDVKLAPTIRRRSCLAVAVVLGLISAVSMAPAGAAAPASPGTAARYAVNVPLCPQSTAPHTMSCFAMRRVAAPPGTPGAYRADQSFASPATACNGTDPIAPGPAGGYTPADLATAYGYNAALKNPKQLVAVVDALSDPNATKDLKTFDACYGLHKETKTSFRVVNQNGLTSPLPKRNAAAGAQISLDIEAVRAVCHTCRILLVEATSASDTNLAAAENRAATMGATEISNSFGEPEQPVSATILAAYNHPGVVITAATGNDGWFGWDVANAAGVSANHPAFPSTDPDVVSVGGTTLYVNNDATRYEEVVWNENGVEDAYGLNEGASLGAGGSGCSARYTAQPWQSANAGYPAAGCGGKRLAADVSAIGDPSTGFDIYDSFQQPGWMTLGGTSFAAPVVAALFALAGGSGGAAYPASSLYVNASHFPTSVYDVVPTGDGQAAGNSFCGGGSTADCGEDVFNEFGGSTHNPNALGGGNVDCSFPRNTTDPAEPPPLSTECNAATGYDGPTGLGTPSSLRLFTNTAPTVALAAPPASPVAHVAETFTAKATEQLSDAHVTSYAFDWGDGQHTSTSSATAQHTYAAAGTYTVTLTVTDNLHQIVIVTAAIVVAS